MQVIIYKYSLDNVKTILGQYNIPYAVGSIRTNSFMLFAIDKDDNLYVLGADYTNGAYLRLLKFDKNLNPIGNNIVVTDNTLLLSGHDVNLTVDALGNVYIVSDYLHKLYRVTPDLTLKDTYDVTGCSCVCMHMDTGELPYFVNNYNQ